MNMRPGHCPREFEAIAAARSARWSAELRSHLRHCEACAEAVVVAELLRQELQAEPSPVLPSAGQVWWRGQMQARRADAERAVQPVRLVQSIAGAFAVLGLVLLLLRYGSQAQQWLMRLPSGSAAVEEPLAWVFLGSTAMFVAAVSAGLGFMRRSSK